MRQVGGLRHGGDIGRHEGALVLRRGKRPQLAGFDVRQNDIHGSEKRHDPATQNVEDRLRGTHRMVVAPRPAQAGLARLVLCTHSYRQDDHDREGGEQHRRAAERADLLTGHLPEHLPSRRVEKNRTTMSWTAPAKITPTMIQMVPGK